MPYSKRIEQEIEAKQDAAEQKRTEVNERNFSRFFSDHILTLYG
jgi:hypothetical protein